MFPCRISSHVLRASTAQSISTSSSRRTNHENNKDDIISHSRGVLWNLLLRQKKVEESFCKISFLYSMHKLPKCTHQFFLLFPRKFHRKQSYFHWILQMITMLSGILCHNRCWHQYPTPWHASMWLQSRNKMFVPLSSRILLEMQHVSLIFCSENKCRFFGKALFDWISLPCKTVLRTLLFGEPFFVLWILSIVANCNYK